MQSRVSHLRRAAGFTLIELMVVVVIATVLLAVAIPSYQMQIRKSRRVDAKTAVLDAAGREERYFSTNGSTYTATATDLGYPNFTTPVGSGYYTIAVCSPACNAGGPAAPSYSITATPVAGTSQAQDAQCTSFTVDSTGAQSQTGTGAAGYCWSN